MHIRKTLLLFIAAIALPIASLQAAPVLPEPAQQAQLKKMAKEFMEKSSAERAHARSVAKRRGWPARKTLPNGKVIEIQRIDDNGRPVYFETLNQNAADTVSTDEVWPYRSAGLSLTGDRITVELGEWDGGGVKTAHTLLSGRVTQVDSPEALSDHSTHVAGTLVASDAESRYQGMAYEARLKAYDWNDDASEMATAASHGMLVSNHSYSIITGWSYDTNIDEWVWYGDIGVSGTEDYGFGFYSDRAKAWDEIAYNAPNYLIVKAAGNDRNDAPESQPIPHWYFDGTDWVKDPGTVTRDPDCGVSGYDCIPEGGTAKNILTIGAVDDIVRGYTSPSDVVMAEFSGWGPTDDGRIKPDLVANGIDVWSTLAGLFFSGPKSGTSMASPNVAGSLILLQQYYESLHPHSVMRSATLKALAIHTADEAGYADGPDYEHGWGLLNTKNAAEVITHDNEGGGAHHIIQDTLNNLDTKTIQINVNEPDAIITATLVWTDPAGTPVQPSLDLATPMLVNDLDLKITNSTTDRVFWFRPWVLDPANPSAGATRGNNVLDNVEQVKIVGAEPGVYLIHISHKGSWIHPGHQDYSLIISTTPRYTVIDQTGFFLGLPTDWTVIDNAGTGATWRFDNPGERENKTGGWGRFAIADSQYYWGMDMDTELRTRPLDFSDFSNVVLEFDTWFYEYVNDVAEVNVSADGGSTWARVWYSSSGTQQYDHKTVDITTEAAFQNDVIIRFRYYNAENDRYWQIDNVKISGVPYDICANGYHLPADQWRLISLPCSPKKTLDTVDVLFGDDLDTREYGRRWIVFERDADTDRYISLPDINSRLQQGEGYYIYSLDRTLLDVEGAMTPLANSVNCSSATGDCYEIPLVKPADAQSTRFNMLGHPFPYPVDWADARIVASGDSANPMTPSEALAQNYLSKIAYKYTGSAYVPYDDVTPGYDEGSLGAFDGFWVETLGGSLSTGELSLLIPNTPAPGVITTDSPTQATASVQVTSSDAVSATVEEKRIPPGQAKRDAHRKEHRKKLKDGEEWFVRLTIEAPGEALKDNGNVLGQLYDSALGYDEHDLEELLPYAPYLTIVFPHDEWNEKAGDYASDYHPVTGKKELDYWQFEIRSDDAERQVTLSWNGSEEILGMSALTDKSSGDVLQPDQDGNYTFIMGDTVRHFRWEYEKRPGNSKKK